MGCTRVREQMFIRILNVVGTFYYYSKPRLTQSFFIKKSKCISFAIININLVHYSIGSFKHLLFIRDVCLVRFF